MVGIRLQNTIVVDTVEEHEKLVNRFRGTDIKVNTKDKEKLNRVNKEALKMFIDDSKKK